MEDHPLLGHRQLKNIQEWVSEYEKYVTVYAYIAPLMYGVVIVYTWYYLVTRILKLQHRSFHLMMFSLL